MKDKYACTLCLQNADMARQTVDSLFMDPVTFSSHLETIHHIPVQGPGETKREARIRFLLDNPEMGDKNTCTCEACKLRRQAHG